MKINQDRLMHRLFGLGELGRNPSGNLSRLAASIEDKIARDKLVEWIREAGLEVEIDRIGNIFGIWRNAENQSQKPIMLGSHIDTVVNAGIYDGSYGVLAALEAVEVLKEQGKVPKYPLVVAAFTNEEGVRYTPDMMGSLVYAGGLDVSLALKTVGTDGSILGEELKKIGYDGPKEPAYLLPKVFIEVHIEQGPILEKNKKSIGVVSGVQGISWKKITVVGTADHAGTTPISMRKDALYGAARIISFLRDYCNRKKGTVATVGTMAVLPNAINIIPDKVTFTVDLRNPQEDELQSAENALISFMETISKEEGLTVEVEQLVNFPPVVFDADLVAAIEREVEMLKLPFQRIISGAGHDAQMMARICPSAMIFVPSKDGISHNPLEFTAQEDLINGANVLLGVVEKLLD